ncbi:Ben and cat operon transcriptional regulator [Ewingella americana]|uniref:Ben and cat operon transcriptional regulator n=1 Tax=Ewingella americana TaxID=41202 RepID=A0A377N6X9_9GAMM|nr:Ben and cat operon transcriptional regulator [Ewingella americana]
MDKIQSMQVFVRVAEMNSFTRAAESLSLPKASVSRLIQQLESQLGVRLLHRSTRRVQLTQDGQVYYDRCKELLASVEEMETLFQANPATISGRLRGGYVGRHGARFCAAKAGRIPQPLPGHRD